MQKLKSQQGSILVGTVVFTLVMAIAGSGLMMMSGNAVNHEQQAFHNDRVFLAAESGLQLGTMWLAIAENWEDVFKNGNNPSSIYDGIIDGIPVRVWFDIGSAKLNSIATLPGLEYDKLVSWGVELVNPGVFINNLNPSQWGPGQGGLNNVWFDGPFHSNTPLVFSAVSNAKADGASVYFTNGPVTVHNDTDHTPFPEGAYGGYGDGAQNNYDFGIDVAQERGGGVDVAVKLDRFFQSSFMHTQPELFLPTIETQTITLPQNNPAAPERALLFYHVNPSNGQGLATYYYYDGAGVRRDMSFGIDQQTVRVPNDISVIGTVKGQTTLITDADYNIYPVGDIVYSDFTPESDAVYANYDNSNNFGVPTEHTNILALVSGGNIQFEMKKRYINETDGTLYTNKKDESSPPYMYLTASLFAYEEGHGLLWEATDGSWSWDPQLMHQNEFNYKLRAIGSRTIDMFFSYTQAGGTVANEQFRFFVDKRITGNFNGPMVPVFRSVNENGQEVNLVTTNWSEDNLGK